MKHLRELLIGRPHLMLEFDEHRGEAGLVTRPPFALHHAHTVDIATEITKLVLVAV